MTPAAGPDSRPDAAPSRPLGRRHDAVGLRREHRRRHPEIPQPALQVLEVDREPAADVGVHEPMGAGTRRVMPVGLRQRPPGQGRAAPRKSADRRTASSPPTSTRVFRAHALLPALRVARDGGSHRLRSAPSLEPPGARSALSGRVHSARGGDGTHRPHRRMGPANGVRPAPAMAQGRPSSARPRGQPVGPPVQPPGSGHGGDKGPRGVGSRPGTPNTRADREYGF